jgi:pyruvate/2-oxoacid:ferredoxin oxidoreductase alpha subunit
MRKQLIKGNEAIVKAAILAGCRAFYGYPITPASEIAEAAAYYMPQVGGVFLQAESEVAAINMVYGAASAGVRTMTASSGPGISLMQEGLSYIAGAELPCVVADIMRAGPGLGNIAPEQGDYHQVVKCGGHGNYRQIVLAPDSAQEMADLTALAFELADRYRNPVFVLTDGSIGQMMEPVEFRAAAHVPPCPDWAVDGTAAKRKNLITSIYLQPDDMEKYILHLEAKYRRVEREEVRFESIHAEDAEMVLIGLRDRRPAAEGRGGALPRQGSQRRDVAAHHPVPVSDRGDPAAQPPRAPVPDSGVEQRPDGRRCPAGPRRPQARGAVLAGRRQRAFGRGDRGRGGADRRARGNRVLAGGAGPCLNTR